MSTPQFARCPSCEVAWQDHLGVAGTCELLQQAKGDRDELTAERDQFRAEVERLTAAVNRRSLAVQQLAEWASTQPDAWLDPLAAFCRTLPGPCICGAHRGSVVMDLNSAASESAALGGCGVVAWRVPA